MCSPLRSTPSGCVGCGTGAQPTQSQDIVARRVHVTSDPVKKEDVRPLPEEEANALVQHVAAYRYLLDGRPAAGVMATDVPSAYSHVLPDGTRCVDYNSLVAELWACVRGLSVRLEECERQLAHGLDVSGGHAG